MIKRVSVCILMALLVLSISGGLVAAAWADHFPAPEASGPGALEKSGPVLDTLTPELKFTAVGALNYVYVYAADNARETLAEQFSSRQTPVFMVQVNAASVQIPKGVLLPGKSYFWYVVSIHAPGSKSEATTTSRPLHFSTSAQSPAGAPPVTAEKAGVDGLIPGLVTDNTAFALDMYKRISTGAQEKNIFFSPYSISTALGMTYAGAREETARQMAGVMHYRLPQANLHAAFASLSERLQAPDGAGYRLKIANALWGQKNYSFRDDFISLVDRHYRGGFNAVDFAGDTEGSRLAVNRWIENETEGKIRELLKAGDLTALTRLVLTNAIYFKGDWAAQFNKEATVKAVFHRRPGEAADVWMMRQSGRFGYADVDGAQVLEMPYAGKELSMVVLLPRAGEDAFNERLTPEALDGWLGRLTEQTVAISLPKFKLETRYDLAGTLGGMGMPDAFDLPPADFSGMTGGKHLYINKVIHQAFIEVNEEGSEAAASTAVIMGVKSMPRTIDFTADRPFVFLIRHKATGSILFLGQVSNPEGI